MKLLISKGTDKPVTPFLCGVMTRLLAMLTCTCVWIIAIIGCQESNIESTESPQPPPTATVQVSPLRATATAKALAGIDSQPTSAELDELIRDIQSIERWILRHTDNLVRCIEAGRIDWDDYSLSMEISASIFTQAGLDWADGKIDSYTPYEVRRSITVMRENIDELKKRCGL